MSEETITVTLPLEDARRAADFWNGCPERGEYLIEWARVIHLAIENALPKPKSPEQVVRDSLLRHHDSVAGHCAFCPENVVADLKSAGWLRDTPDRG